MQVTVYGPLRSATGTKTVTLDVGDDPVTVSELLDAFVAAYPRARTQLFTDADAVRGSVRVAVDGERAALDDVGPIQVVGTGATINDATDNAFDRAGTLLDMDEGEVCARCTFTGGVEIGRLPGVVQLTMLAPMDRLEVRGLASVVREQYGL